MDCIKSKLTVYFDDPFWVGIFERNVHEELAVAKVVFGSEPKDYQVYDLLLKNWKRLKFGLPVSDKNEPVKKVNPKRIQKSIGKLLSQSGIGTKAQQAIKRQFEQNKIERKTYSRRKREEEKQQQFELRQQKRTEKHKGR